jgi:hypothetical protein
MLANAIFLRSVLAVIPAAVCAAALVGFVPEPTSAVAAGTSQPQLTVASFSEPVLPVAPTVGDAGAGCAQGWPYYEPSCLHDSRQPNGKARVVRVIPADHPKVLTARARF